MNRKSLARILAGLALAIGVAAATGLGPGAPLAHAAYIPPPVPCGPYVSCYQAPSMTLTGGNGEIVISGAHWAANRWIEIDGSIPKYWWWSQPSFSVLTDSSGSFQAYYYPPYDCFFAQMEIQAIDRDTYPITVVSGYAVPGCGSW